MSTKTLEELFGEGLHIGDGLVAKAVLRVPVRSSTFPAMQGLVDNLELVYQDRLAKMKADIEEAINGDGVSKSDSFLVIGGSLLVKAQQPSQPKKAAQPKQNVSVQPGGERKKTPDGYLHVQSPGSRGGKFYRDDKGNVRYGERPTGRFQQPAEPEHVIAHYQQYMNPSLFMTHQDTPMFEALRESDALTPQDHAFMDWWSEAYDVFLESFKKTRKQIDKAGGIENVELKIGGRVVSYGEAVEEFFKANVELFVGDPDYGQVEDEDDILDAVRSTMKRYQEALNKDKKVQAMAMAAVEEREVKKNAFFIKAEHMVEEYAPLAGDLFNVNNAEDLGLRFVVAMKDLGLIEKGRAGKVTSKYFRGSIIPSAGTVEEKGDVWGSLDRLTAPQLMSVFIAERLQSSLNRFAVYHPAPISDSNHFHNVHSRMAFEAIAKNLGMGTDFNKRQILLQQLEAATQGVVAQLNGYNGGQDPTYSEVFDLGIKDVAGDADALEKFQKKQTDRKNYIRDVLAAQEDSTWKLPDTMKKGVWNGKTLKDKNDPSKGVWEPFNYQKQYVNWMTKVKRGIVAADAGMGKTPTVIAFMESLRAAGKDQRAIIYMPPSLLEQWPKEIAAFAPDMQDKILDLNGLSLEERKAILKSDMVENSRYILLSTGSLTGGTGDPNAEPNEDDGTGGTDSELTDILSGIEGAVFVDEVHQSGFKKAGNTRHELVKSIIGQREYSFGMTATPMPNDPMDVYHLANLFAPGSVGDMDHWQGKLAGADQDDQGNWRVTHPEHIAELNARIKPFVFYKSLTDPEVVADQGKGLPEKRGIAESDKKSPHHVSKKDEQGNQVEPTKMWETEGDLGIARQTNSANGKSQEDYFKNGGTIDLIVKLRVAQLIRERNEKVKHGEIDPNTNKPYEPYNPAMLQMMSGGYRRALHRQASISPGLIDPTYKRADGGVAHSPKLKALGDDIMAHFSNGGHGGESAKPIVVFSSYPGKAWPLVKKMLAERGIDPSRVAEISSEVSPEKRGYTQDMLNAGHVKVLLVGVKSGGAGLNLQKASNKMLFLDEPYTPADKRQAQGRVWRTGQASEHVYEKTYRTMGTFDTEVEGKLAGKQTMVTALLGKDAPTADTFDTAVAGNISQLTGRKRAPRGSDLSEDDIKNLMDSANKLEIDDPDIKNYMKDIHSSEDWQKLMGAGGRGGAGAEYTDEDFKPNKEAQKKFKKEGVNPSIGEEFDEKQFRLDWESKREERRAPSLYKQKLLLADVKRKEGDHAAADKYERDAREIALDYPVVDGGKAQKEEESYQKKRDNLKAPPPGPKGEKKEPEKQAKKEPAKEPAKDSKAKKEEKPEPKKPAEKAKPEAEKPKKVVHTNKMGLQFGSKKHSFDESMRKVKGHDVKHAEAGALFDMLRDSKARTFEEFLDKEIKPLWDDEGGKNKYSATAAKKYMKQFMDLYAEQGLIHKGDE